ncbi:GGDEF domain-containing protein [Roseospira navarrensis]|uniref:diguanylate cyclase n=1 Tax=Roseospira navarrensis TaxID=140058 RepID=A0A7X1ZFJ8_9PROT|nr:GGDEF domain-containing protein [Roseospira navarrensis]MQX36661.1 diguanylate cyclase [Roseospira navarrensis]
MIEYSETMSEAQETARKAMDSMRQYGVVPSPQNFLVWYLHHSQRMPDLSREIDRLIALGSDFNQVLVQTLHDRFISQTEERKALAAAGTHIENTLEQLIAMFNRANKGTEHYGQTLKGLSDKVEGATGETLHGIVATVVAETQKMIRLNQKMGTELSQSSEEISKLRQDLDRVRSEARTDGLTGISNRKVFDTVLREATEAAVRNSQHLCLMMLDIDLFKRFNDTHGHQMGDQILKLVARTLQNCVRSEDTVSRYGGEEFAAILPATPLQEAVAVAERIRMTVANKRITNRRSGKELGRITLSIGVAEYAIGESVNDLVQRADRALYMGKRLGRNQVVSQAELDHAHR